MKSKIRFDQNLLNRFLQNVAPKISYISLIISQNFRLGSCPKTKVHSQNRIDENLYYQFSFNLSEVLIRKKKPNWKKR